jgi:hypothetical protein
MADVKFEDFSLQVAGAIDEAAIQWLYESGATLQRQAANNTRVGTGETAGKWESVVDEGKGVCTIGNPLENAIWEEFGKNILRRIKIGQNRLVILWETWYNSPIKRRKAKLYNHTVLGDYYEKRKGTVPKHA